GDIGLVTVLLPEHQFVGLRLHERVGGDERASLRKIADDGVRLRQIAILAEFHQRHLPHAAHGEELRRAGFARYDVDRDPLIGEAQKVGGVLHLQAIARNLVAIDFHHAQARLRMPIVMPSLVSWAFSSSRRARRYSTGMILTNFGRYSAHWSMIVRARADSVYLRWRARRCQMRSASWRSMWAVIS